MDIVTKMREPTDKCKEILCNIQKADEENSKK